MHNTYKLDGARTFTGFDWSSLLQLGASCFILCYWPLILCYGISLILWNVCAQPDIGQLQNSTAGNICLPENIKNFDLFTCKPWVAKRFDLLGTKKKKTWDNFTLFDKRPNLPWQPLHVYNDLRYQNLTKIIFNFPNIDFGKESRESDDETYCVRTAQLHPAIFCHVKNLAK